MQEMMHEEMERLQTVLAFQEHSLAELNEALVGQQKQIDLLQLQLRLLQERLADIESGHDQKSHNTREEKPPHY